jgi:type I restriction enzyme S subunit
MKDTPLGPIPTDWDVITVSDLGTVVTGTTPATNEPVNYGGEFMFISPSDLSDVRQVWSSQKWLSLKGLRAARELPVNTVLVSCIGLIGKTGMTTRERSATNQQINALICNQDTDPGFAYYLLTYSASYIASRATKTTVPILNKGNFQALEVFRPPLAEQRRIAAVLNVIQDAIASQEDVIAAARAFKRSLMHRLFTYGPGPVPAATKETEIGEIPEDWRVTTLGDLCDRSDGLIQTGPFGSQLHAHDYVPIGTPTIMPQDMVGNRVSTENIARIGPEDHARLSRYHLKKGDIVYARRGDIGRRALVTADEEGWLCGTGSMFIRVESREAHPPFLFHFLGLPGVVSLITSRAVGSTMLNLNARILRSVPIALPEPSKQVLIADSLAVADAKIAAEEDRKTALEVLFKSMLHELMTGRRRLLRDDGLPLSA